MLEIAGGILLAVAILVLLPLIIFLAIALGPIILGLTAGLLWFTGTEGWAVLLFGIAFIWGVYAYTDG